MKVGLSEVLWTATILWLAGGLFGFAARPRTALRLRSVEYGSLLIVLVRAVLLSHGVPLRADIDLPLFLAVLAAPVLLARWEIWVVRCGAPEFWRDVEAGCRGLLLPLERMSPSRAELEARGRRYSAWVLDVDRGLVLAILPRVRKGKVTLLVNWLSKQYPGPFPRPRILLRRKNK